MQVEVSEAGSPTTQTNEASSPTDQESYDGDVDKDVNSADDEELWGASPHPSKLGEFGINFKLHDITEEKEHKGSKLSTVVHNNENHIPPPLIEEESGDHQARVMGIVSSLSPRSILPDEDKKNDVVDLKSTNGDILESRSSGSSEGLTSQMQSKAEHLAVYLASLPPSPSESGSNILEDMELSHVREPSADEIFPDEIIDASYEVDENKEESRESKELEGSQGSSEESTITSQIEATTETSSTFNEFSGGELKKEHVDHQDSSITEQNEHSRRNEDEGELLTSNENGVNYSPKEAISDSFSTTCQEDTYEHSRLEEDMKFAPQIEVQSEVKDDLLTNQVIHVKFLPLSNCSFHFAMYIWEYLELRMPSYSLTAHRRRVYGFLYVCM
ncbi:hypothetical protein BVRB_7g172610 isoform B [Beta vulgaris subsp. vulgaris]|nr:hypothetical protein BVRB_7g172610 isoform B [Beta vulgaris subsp. vulgaris]